MGSSRMRRCGSVEGRQAHEQASLLAARQARYRRLRFRSAEAETRGPRPRLRDRHVGHPCRHVVVSGGVRVEFVDLMLGEIGHVHLGRRSHFALQRREAAADELAEGGFAVAVGAQQRDAVIGLDGQVQPLEDGAVAIPDRDPFDRDQGRRQHPLGARQIEGKHVVLDDGGDRIELRQALDPRLRLARLRGFRFEAVDEGLQVLALRVLLHLCLRGQLAFLGELLGKRRVAAAIDRQLGLIEMQDVADAGVEQFAVVADHQHGVRVAAEVIVEPERALEIEIIGRLVEQQEIRLREQDGGQRHAHAPAAREGGARPVLCFGIEAEPMQDGGGARRRRIGADIGQPRLDLGAAEAVRVSRPRREGPCAPCRLRARLRSGFRDRRALPAPLRRCAIRAAG